MYSLELLSSSFFAPFFSGHNETEDALSIYLNLMLKMFVSFLIFSVTISLFISFFLNNFAYFLYQLNILLIMLSKLLFRRGLTQICSQTLSPSHLKQMIIVESKNKRSSLKVKQRIVILKEQLNVNHEQSII